MSTLAPGRARAQPRRRRLVAGLAAAAVAAGLTIAGVESAAAESFGSIAGRLRLPSGAVAAGATVAFEPVTGSQVVTTTTDQAGEYFTSVPAGDYRVRFTSGALSSYAYGQRAAEAARVFTVGADRIVQVDDTLLIRADASISGTVKDTAGNGIDGVCVRAYPADFRENGLDPSLCLEPGRNGVLTTANGSFTLSGLPQGIYELEMSDPAGRYVAATVPRVQVRDGENVTGVTITLARAGSISGITVDGRTGAPLPDLCVQAFRSPEDRSINGLPACSGADGRWRLGGLAPGRYLVLVNGDAAHARRFVGGGGKASSARTLKVVAGRDRFVGTVPMFEGATLTGRITDTTGAPVPEVKVTIGVYAPEDAGYQFAATTDEDGRYRITGVSQMREIASVVVGYDQPYAWQWSGGAADPARARPLALRYGRTTTYDAVLQPGATLRVRVQGVVGEDGVSVQAFSESGLAAVGSVNGVIEDGETVLTNMPAGTVTIRGRFIEGPVRTFWYDGATSPQAATKVPVAVGPPGTITLTVPSR